MQIIAVGAGRGKDVRLPGPPSPLLPTISTCFNANSVAQPFSDRNPHVPPRSRRQRAACLGHRGVGLNRPTGQRPQPSPCPPPERLRGYDSRIVRLAAAYARDSPAGRPESHSTAAPTSPHRTAVRRIRCRPTRDPSHGLSRAARSESRPNPVRGAGAVDPRLLRAGGHAGHDVPGQLLLPGRLRGPRPLPRRHRVPQPGAPGGREGGAKTGRV